GRQGRAEHHGGLGALEGEQAGGVGQALGEPGDQVEGAPGAPEVPLTGVPVQPWSPAGPPTPTAPRAPVVPGATAGRPGPDPDDPLPFPGPRTSGEPLPDWWLKGPVGLESDPDAVPGFVGGVEIPELLESPRAGAARPKEKDGKEPPADTPPPPAGEQAEGAGEAGGAQPRRRRRLVPLPSGKWSNPLLLLAAASLVAGAVLGSLLPLGAGLLIAYLSRRLTDREKKFAVLWIPGGAVSAGLVWLWGRSEGRWGEPVVAGHMNDAIAETWPWVVRGAAVTAALYLVWRSQRNN
ncbi:hypothetical protein ACVNF4_10610, partial [Streptomyces sp. S6]